MPRRIQIALLLLLGCLPVWGNGGAERLEHYLSARLAGRTDGSGLTCAFAYPLLLSQYWPRLNPALKSALGKPYLAPPASQDSTNSPSGYFVLHFDRTGDDAVPAADLTGNGIPDYIDSAGVILDYVRTVEVEEIGFQPPAGPDGGPAPSYHVYFQDLGFEYGATFPEAAIPGPPGFLRYTSYMVMDNDYQDANYFTTGLNALKVTAAHEFQHAIQLSYRVWAKDGLPTDLFLMEMTATWLEDVLYEDINDYLQYLPFFFANYSGTPFDNSDFFYPFGNSLFLHMLEKQYGTVAGRQIWEEVTGRPGLEAVSVVLGGAGTSFVAQLHQYGIWLSYAGAQADPLNFFPEGTLYPQLFIDPEDQYIFDQRISASWEINPLATRLVQLELLSGGEYTLTVNSNRTPGKVSHRTPRGITGTISVNESALLYLLAGETTVILLTNAAQDSAQIHYELVPGTGTSRRPLVAFPNPVVTSRDEQIAFINIPEAGEIYILNSTGRRVTRLPATPLSGTVIWDLKDEYRQEVASGTYLYLFKGQTVTETGKFAVVR